VITVEHPLPPAPAPERGVLISRGRRCWLRTLTLPDLDLLTDWVDDPFIERMVGSEFLQTYKHVYDKSPDFYQAVLTDPTQVVLVIEANERWDKPIGIVRLYNIHLLEGYAFLEVIVTDHRALRRGFGIEAGQLIICYGVDVLGLRRIEAKAYEYNVLSINSMKKNGFVQEGVLRNAGFDGEKFCNVVVFGILREEIDERRRKLNLDVPLEGAEGNVIDPT
jgi:RimJ/RimL family protein N-acetyltransferase